MHSVKAKWEFDRVYLYPLVFYLVQLEQMKQSNKTQVIRYCPGKPKLVSKGRLVNDRWVWDPVQWVRCRYCKMWHSNREFPAEYLAGDWGMDVQDKTKVGVMLIKNNEIFMTETYHTSIGFPKGEKEPNETIKQCAEREFYEESGKRIRVDDYNYKIIRMNVYRVTYVFFVIRTNDFVIDTHPKDTKEVTSYGWFNVRKIKYLDRISNISRIVIGLYVNQLSYLKKYSF